MSLRLGVLGLSQGNGHPYSWSAIFNGYDATAMETCGFPVIPRYLEKQSWPDDRIPGANVTHVWTQDTCLSQRVAQAACIPNVVERPEQMIGAVDAILLARDDAEAHFELAAPFLRAGLPVYIDKPVALSLPELDRLYALQQYPGQIFTCSALRYAAEFQLAPADRAALGSLRYLDAVIPKDWDKYAVHAIEPLLMIVGKQGAIADCSLWQQGGIRRLQILWASGMQAAITAVNAAAPIAIRVVGERGWRDLVFSDTFPAFRAALADFVDGVKDKSVRTDPLFVRRVVEIIQLGRAA